MKHGEFMERFTGGTLDRADWTHEAHVRAAWLCLDHTGGDWRAALTKVREGIATLNAAYRRQGVVECWMNQEQYEAALKAQANPPPSYHATVTGAFVRLIAGRKRPGQSYAHFRAENPDLYDKLTAVLEHYSPELLFSDGARSRYVRPDLRPLPAPVPAEARELAFA